MKITLDTPKDFVIVSQVTNQLNEITIEEMVDSPNKKIVVARTIELGFITLWEGDEYDTIGQWTDNDVLNRIKEIYGI